jgi:hypothetical protein
MLRPTLLLLVLPATAWAQLPVTQPRTATPTGSDNRLPPDLQLERARYCLDCHDGPANATATTPGGHWKGSMMANAARDPLMYAALAIANQDVPGIGGTFCLRCHSPAGFTGGHATPHPTNPNGWPCNTYAPGSPTACRCLNPPTCDQLDYCQETAARVANGYCIVAFDDRKMPEQAGFRGHPRDPSTAPQEPYDQTSDNQHDDQEGLNCAFCHRLDPAQATAGRTSGAYLLSTAATQPAGSGWATPRSMRFGPYANAYTACTDPNDSSTCSTTQHGHSVTPSSLHQQAELCGFCHDVTNPVLNRVTTAGVDMGFRMPIERTFSEWKASDYRIGGPLQEICQSCHMPRPANAGPVCASVSLMAYNRNRQGADGEEVHQHEFAGGNVWLPTVFANVIAPTSTDMGNTGDPPWFFDLITRGSANAAYLYTAQAATAMLQRAGTLSIVNAPASVASGANLTFQAHVENNTGHKLPTGYPEGRRMWLQVIVHDGTNAPFFQSGAYDDATGVLTHDAQIKIYEVEMSKAGKTAPPSPPEFHFVGNQIVWKDNRIPPSGFDPAAPNFQEMAPVGATYPVQPNGKLASWDDTSYTVPIPKSLQTGVKLTVRLVYQTASKEYVDFLRSANTTNGRGDDMTRIWENHGRGKYVVMAEQTLMLPNLAPCVPGAEVCDGQDNDCNGVTDDGDICVDMTVPPEPDMAAPPDDMTEEPRPDMTERVPEPGCGVSVAGTDYTDLGLLSMLLSLIPIYLRKRPRRSSNALETRATRSRR